jgi:hypothetical protein
MDQLRKFASIAPTIQALQQKQQQAPNLQNL